MLKNVHVMQQSNDMRIIFVALSKEELLDMSLLDTISQRFWYAIPKLFSIKFKITLQVLILQSNF